MMNQSFDKIYKAVLRKRCFLLFWGLGCLIIVFCSSSDGRCLVKDKKSQNLYSQHSVYKTPDTHLSSLTGNDIKLPAKIEWWEEKYGLLKMEMDENDQHIIYGFIKDKTNGVKGKNGRHPMIGLLIIQPKGNKNDIPDTLVIDRGIIKYSKFYDDEDENYYTPDFYHGVQMVKGDTIGLRLVASSFSVGRSFYFDIKYWGDGFVIKDTEFEDFPMWLEDASPEPKPFQ